jgi:uncharacterized membrane protein (GlpM family)
MLKMLKKKTTWSQKKVTHIEKERERVGEEELRHTIHFGWYRPPYHAFLKVVYLWYEFATD